MNRRFIFTTLMVLLICGAPLVASAQLFDGERDGLLLGVGVGFAGVVSYMGYDSDGQDSSFRASGPGFLASGRIGYGLSDQFSLFLSSTVRDFSPHLGFMYFTDSDAYLQGLIGFVSSENVRFVSSDVYSEKNHFRGSDKDRHLIISGGIGYELRDQISLEFMLGYIRPSYIKNTWNAPVYGSPKVVAREKFWNNIMMIAVTFNVHFY